LTASEREFSLCIYTTVKAWQQVSDCCLTASELFFNYIMTRTFGWDYDVSFILNQHTDVSFILNTLSWIFIVLAYWNNSLQVNMLLHWDILGQNQLVFVLTPWCCMFNTGAVTTNFMVFGLTRLGLEPMIYCNWGDHATS
jgi:hypothetical protein